MAQGDERLEVALGMGQPVILAIHCSDPGAQLAFRAVLEKRYGDQLIETVAVPGGAWWVARAASATKSKARRMIAGRLAGNVEEAIESALSRRTLKGVELLGHQGCGWYERLAKSASAGELVRKQAEDLYLASEELARWSRLPVSGRIVLDAGGGAATVRTLFG